MEDLQLLLDVVNTLGTVGLLVWLVVTGRSDLKAEQSAHELTRREYREDLRDMANLAKKTNSQVD